MMALRDKYKHRWFAEHILQKATGLKAQAVKDMLTNSNITYKVIINVKIKNGRIISLDTHNLEAVK